MKKSACASNAVLEDWGCSPNKHFCICSTNALLATFVMDTDQRRAHRNMISKDLPEHFVLAGP